MKHSIHPRKLMLFIVSFLVLTLFLNNRVFAQPGNDVCGSATVITTGSTCNTGTSRFTASLKSADKTSGILTCGGNTNSADAWYVFTAQSAYPTIALTNLGADLVSNSRGKGALIQVLDGTCGSFTSSLACASDNNDFSVVPGGAGLSVGTVYYIRIATNNNSTTTSGNGWGYTICVTDPPANDLCTGAINLVSGTSCANTAGTLTNATYVTLTGACGSASGNRNDVWYKFTAKSANPVITLGSAPTQRSIQLFSGACGSLTSEQCAVNSTTLASSGLTPGDVYYVRIWSDNNTAGTFNICVTDPAPANDLCSGATVLTPAVSCSNTAGNFYASTVSTPPTISASCAGTVTYDMWYSFVATATNATITLSSVGSSIASPGLQLLSGNCATTMTSLACGNPSVSSSSLVIGNTYYIRAYSGGAAPASAINADFNICVTYVPPPPPANDLCTGAIAITSGTSCVNTAGTLTNSTYTTLSGACGTASGNRNDVWYSFIANTTNPTITLGSAPAQRSIQLFSGSCGSLISEQCAVNNTSLTASGLNPGDTYYVRIWSDNNTSGTFNICVTDPAPANNLCSGATTLTAGLTCSNTAGNFYASTVSAAPAISGSCAGVVVNDLWYTFIAPAASATITLSGIGSSITNPGLELLSGDCTTMYSMGCGGSSLLASALTPGSTYYIRAYSTGAAPTSGAGAVFNICVTYATPPPPPNDECSGAINLPVNGGCTKTLGTVNSATRSTGIPTSCTTTTVYDVWYKFTAINTAANTITIGDFGTGFAGTRRMELYSGTCGSLTSLACGTTTITQSLATGTTYYIRLYTTTGPIPTVNGDFSICISNTSPPPRVGNSYVNISKNRTGGVVQKGDTLEIRLTVWVGAGTLYKTRYLDNIPSNTQMLATTNDSIRVITNEGLTYKRYTPVDITNDDAGTYISSPAAGAYNIRLNLGHNAGNWPGNPLNNTSADITGAGNLPSTANPRGGSGLMFATSFRVKVTGNVGDTITLNGGQFIYRTSTGGTDIPLSGIPYKILITDPLTLCSNSIGINNASEFGGTFGSGTTLNRATDLSFPISGYTFVAASSGQAIGDGQYAIVNNSSPLSSTKINAYRKPNCITPAAPDMLCANRMFGGYWYIKGDHTGTSNATGKAPAASGSTGGYMLAVNADYVASEAYRQTLSGLCPNTYYEFSAWIQNICPTCGSDSTGAAQFSGTSTSPLNGYPGVYPNLSFSLDGVDRYSTGQVDTVGWLKKGFVFLTGPSQTTATLSIRNNSQGGGGNDWVMDDISIATCFPSMSYSPTATPVVCKGNTITIGDTVRSQFSNYTYYVWQRSQDNGATWADITTTQSATPVFNGSQYQYITSYDVPPTATNPADSGDIYRVYTATTPSNITSPNCIANDGSAPISLSVLDCGVVLKTDLLSFNGNLMNKNAVLSWSTSREDQPVHFELQRSDDNISFTTIATIKGKNSGQSTNYYSFTDPDFLSDKKWYRVILIADNNGKKYSRILQLGSNMVDFAVENVINPFSEQLSFNLILSKSSKVNAELIDMQGKIVKSNSYVVYAGVNSLRISNTTMLASGIYTLRMENNGVVISKKVLKK